MGKETEGKEEKEMKRKVSFYSSDRRIVELLALEIDKEIEKFKNTDRYECYVSGVELSFYEIKKRKYWFRSSKRIFVLRGKRLIMHYRAPGKIYSLVKKYLKRYYKKPYIWCDISPNQENPFQKKKKKKKVRS